VAGRFSTCASSCLFRFISLRRLCLSDLTPNIITEEFELSEGT